MATDSTAFHSHGTHPFVWLIGAGTVGRAILCEFLRSGFEVLLIDASEDALLLAEQEARRAFPDISLHRTVACVNNLPALRFKGREKATLEEPSWPAIVLESIPESLALKQSLFEDLRKVMPAQTILASNTSNLRINDVFSPLGSDSRCCGLHFFMPVDKRPLIEFIATEFTSPSTQMACEAIARSLGKAILLAADSPGFVVNRLLVPYLNQSLLMLERGVDANQLAEAAMHFGMPLSPLKLIDTIGIRTAFDSGRIFWQSFPDRLDPAPILPGMIKAKRLGNVTGGGFFDSHALSPRDDETSMKLNPLALNPVALAVIAKYKRESHGWSTEEVTQMIALPMWIEAAEVLATGIVNELSDVELAMRGGLGYDRPEGFFGYFEAMGRERLLTQIETYGATFRGLRASVELVEAIKQNASPNLAITQYAKRRQNEVVP